MKKNVSLSGGLLLLMKTFISSYTERKISFIISKLIQSKFAFGQSLSADVADVDVVYILDSLKLALLINFF